MSERDFVAAHIAVITISDTRTIEDDKSGQTLVERITRDGHRLAARMIVKDVIADIQDALKYLTSRDDVDVVITTGGTGLTGRDVTVEAARPLFEK
jgi:molybdopterin adenylyltransferase